MPPIDYRQARSRIRLAEVLDLAGFEASWCRGEQARGPCPVHHSRTPLSRSFAADHGKQLWHCFRCGAGGNALDLWMEVTRLPLHAAVLDLCKRLGRDVPWLRRPHIPERRTMSDP
jgi:DNA primase (bacterial type)